MDIPAHGHGGPVTPSPAAEDISEAKAALRRELRRRRALHAADPRHEHASRLIADRLIARLDASRIVAGYRALPGEVDPAEVLMAAARQGRTTALPHITDRGAPLRFLRWRPGDPLEPGPFGLSQPRGDAEAVSPDLILTPLLGFDATLARIGMGAGFYDRAFADHPHAIRIGLARADQQVEPIPCDPWDVPLHAIATETHWLEAA